VTVLSSSATVLAAVGTELREVERRAENVTAGGWTALYDAIQLSGTQAKNSHNSCRALVVISDGMDNHSRITRHELKQILIESDVQVYSLVIGDTPAGRKPIELAEGQRSRAFLNDLAQETGGLSIRVTDSTDIQEAAHRISDALRERYVIGFRPADRETPGKWHKIQIKTGIPKVNVYARSGYRSPS
jgi:VWFA-related protein